MTRQSFATKRSFPLRRASIVWFVLAHSFVLAVAPGAAQQAAPSAQQPVRTLFAIPPTAGIRVVPIVQGLSHPWNLAFLPDGTMLVTERPGRLRVIRNGVLDPQPVAGVPQVHAEQLAGLMGVAIHPRFAENKLVYLTYSKPGERGSTPALARGRFDDTALTDVRDIFVADAWGNMGIASAAGSAIAFGPDGMLYMTVGGAINSTTTGKRAQDPNDHTGKVLRLRDAGASRTTIRSSAEPVTSPIAISWGLPSTRRRVSSGPVSMPRWGGDEVNVILPGRNYGWPLVSYWREYEGPRVSERPWQEGMEQPAIVWIPSIAPSGMTFYTGDRFPAWKGNLFVASLQRGRILRTGHLERVVFNERGEELRRESLLTELKQRIRDVRQGPDGLLYVLTEENEAALLRIEPGE